MLKLSISSKFVIFCSVLILTFALLLKLLTYHLFYNSFINLELNSVTHESELITQLFNKESDELIEDVRLLANIPAVWELVYALQNNDEAQLVLIREQIEHLLSQFLNNKSDYFRVRYVGVGNIGKEILRVEKGASGELIYAEEEALGYEAVMPYFQDAIHLQYNEVYLSGIQLDKQEEIVFTPHRPTIRAATPFFNAEGELFGLVVLDKNMQESFRFLEQFTKDGKLYIANENQDFLYHPSSEKAFLFELGDRYTLQNEFDEFFAGKQLDSLTLQDSIVHGDRAISANKAFINSAHKIRNVIIIVEHAFSSVTARSTQLMKELGVLSAVCLLLAIFFTIKFSKIFSKPLVATRNFAIDYIKGRRDQRDQLPISQNDEVGDVAQALSSLVSSLEKQADSREEVIHQLEESKVRLEKQAQELETQRKNAESASRVKTDFLANMSHEIRTPMNGVAGMIALLQDTSLSDEQRRYIDTLKNCSDGLLSLINDILDLSKIEEDMFTIRGEPTYLADLLKNVVTLFFKAASDKNIVIQLNCSSALDRPCFVDPVRVRQIVVNLLGNAIKFNKRDDTIVVAADVHESVVAISVEDHGVGIPKENQADIFDPFTQVDNSLTRSHGGTGLGLSISVKLARLMGGEIVLESEPNVLTRFTLKIPMICPIEAPPTPVNEAATETPHAIEQGLKVLAVDDDNTNRMIIRKFLGKMGCTVQLAENGLQALGRCQLERFDLIIVDIQMPYLDGVKTVEHLKRNGSYNQATPIIAATANAFEEDRQRYLQVGMSGYISKPIS